MPQVTVGVSLKTYFGHERASAWFDEVAARVRTHDAVVTVAVDQLRAAIDADPARTDTVVVYGAAAGPGLLATLGDVVFLGRFAQDPDALVTVLDEAATIAAHRQGIGA